MPHAAQPSQEPGTHNLPTQVREAQLVPSTFNESDNTIEVVWTQGARVRRYDWYSDTPYEEELAVEPEAVDMTRFEAGTVQVLDGHRTYGGVEAILGVAVRGWIADGEGRAVIRLSQRPELAGVIADIRAGIIRAISFGYSVQRYEITRAMDRTDGVNIPLYRAVAWTPQEISFVTVPADPGAGTRSQPNHHSQGHGAAPAAPATPCEFVRAVAHSTTEPAMPNLADQTTGSNNAAPESTTQTRQATAPVQAPAEGAGDAAVRAEQQRGADITDLCTRHGVGNLAAGLIRSGSTVEQARTAVLDELSHRDAAAGGHRNVAPQIQTARDEMQVRLAGIEQAIMHRIAPATQLDDNGRNYRGLSLLEMGREFLAANHVETRGMDRMRLATEMLNFRVAGAHGTSDFSSLFANVANKRLRSAYDENPGTYQLWARRAPNAPDFKSINVTQLSGAPDLLQINEHGEFKYGQMKDGGETYGVATYGRIVSLTRQAIINDDLRAFERMVSAFGFASRRIENRLVYSQLTANANLSDSVALFEASTHKNLQTGAGSALQFSSLTTARTAMRLQKGLAGEELNLSPAYLIVPAALEQTAYQLTSSNYVPAKQSDVNEFRQGGRTALTPIVEPVLDANSATAWYLASDSSQVDTVEYCYLEGAEGPVIETQPGFEVDGISYKCRLDFAAKALDFRGLNKAAGA